MILCPPFLKRGITLMPNLILIPKETRDNAPYLVHEQVHTMQQKVDGVLTFWWRYLTSKAYRQAYEVEAYKEQIANGASVLSCAVQLSNGYGLNLTQAESLKLLEA